MYEYYFKIKKGDIEFECLTTDKITFEEKLDSDMENFFIMDLNGDSIISRDEVEAQLY